MTTTRPKLGVEVMFSKEMNRLTLIQKDVPPQENSFFIQLLSITDGVVRLTVRINDAELTEIEVTRKEFTTLRDTIRQILEIPGKAGIVTLSGNKIQILHFENGEIGFGIGKGKYQLEKDDATLLHEYCAKVM